MPEKVPLREDKGRIRDEVHVRFSFSVVTFAPGHPVTLGWVDRAGHKRIVDFGDRLIYCMSDDWIARHVEIVSPT